MKIDCQTKQKLIPLLSNALLAITNLYCLLVYYSNVTGKDLMHFAYIAYTTMMANGLIGITAFLYEESFVDLRILLEYGQLVLSLPCLTADLWLKHDVGPWQVASLHAFFGLGAFFFFVILEYQRQDLTDLALLVSMVSMLSVGLLYSNYFATSAAFLFSADDEFFCDLRVLLDYAHLVLPLPFITTEIWLKHDVGPREIAIAHCCFGLAAFFFFVLMEYKRQDLTDLALLFSIMSLITVGCIYENYSAVGAACIVTLSYFLFKRKEECAVETNMNVYPFAMVAFSFASLASFDPSGWVPALS